MSQKTDDFVSDKKDKKSINDRFFAGVPTEVVAVLAALGTVAGGYVGKHNSQELPKFEGSVDSAASAHVRQLEGATGKIMTNAEALAAFHEQRDAEAKNRAAQTEEVKNKNVPGIVKSMAAGAAVGVGVIPALVGVENAAGWVQRKRKEKEEAAQSQENSRT